MSQRLTRKEIKQKDQFVTSMEHTLDYGKSHLKPILTGVVAVVVVAIVAVLAFVYLEHRGKQAALALNEAVETYSAPVTGLDSAEGEEEETFETEEGRRAAARERFEQVRSDYGSSQAGQLAGIYLAKIAAQEGDLAQAQELWKGYVESGGQDMLAAQVQLNLLALERQQGDLEAVVEKLQGMLAADRAVLPADVVLFELATTLESLSRGQEALTYYQRIVDEFPRSQYSFEARQKAAKLGEAGATTAG